MDVDAERARKDTDSLESIFQDHGIELTVELEGAELSIDNVQIHLFFNSLPPCLTFNRGFEALAQVTMRQLERNFV
jgi:hypothetical protein